MNLRRLILSVGGGTLITLMTGFVPTRTLMGATHYGVPRAWLIRRVLAPGYVPWRLDWTGLLVDLLIWSAVVFVLFFIYDRFG